MDYGPFAHFQDTIEPVPGARAAGAARREAV